MTCQTSQLKFMFVSALIMLVDFVLCLLVDTAQFVIGGIFKFENVCQLLMNQYYTRQS